MRNRPLTLFALQSSRTFAEGVAGKLDLPLGLLEERIFEDGEHKTRPLQEVRGHDVFVLHSLYGDTHESGNDKLCRLLFFCGALKDAGAACVTAVTPYLCYARKDRRTKSNDPITTRYVAAMFEAVGIDRVMTLEVHNIAAFENAFRCPTVHIESAPLLAAHLAPLCRGERIVVVSPDAGGVKRAEQFRQAMEQMTQQPIASAYMEKYRSSGVVTGELLAGDVRGRVAVIVDDLISTGGTLIRAANACLREGATRIITAAAHGLFIEGAVELFSAPKIEVIAVTNTVPPFRVPPDLATSRLNIIDASEPIARAISSLHDGS
jgi:ribose-phosphate pyrophosphokinase